MKGLSTFLTATPAVSNKGLDCSCHMNVGTHVLIGMASFVFFNVFPIILCVLARFPFSSGSPTNQSCRDAGVSGLSSDWSDRCLDSPRLARWEAGVEPFTTTVAGGRRGEAVDGGGGGLGGLQQVSAKTK